MVNKEFQRNLDPLNLHLALGMPQSGWKNGSAVKENWQLLQKTHPDLISSTTWQLITVCNSSPRRCDTFFWPLWSLCVNDTWTYIQATHIHEIKTKVKNFQKKNIGIPWSWRNGSVVKCTIFSSRGLGFNSQSPHGSLQLPVSPVLGDLTPSHSSSRGSDTLRQMYTE